MQEKTETEARLRQFEAVGGVNLWKLEPEERQALRANVIVGLAHHKRATFTYRCFTCGNTETTDQAMSPACTGPSWMDEHPLEPMELIQ